MKSNNVEQVLNLRTANNMPDATGKHSYIMQILNWVITGNSESSSYHPSSSYSIFPMENNEIMTSNWEEQVIWEDDDLRKLCGLLLIRWETIEGVSCRSEDSNC